MFMMPYWKWPHAVLRTNIADALFFCLQILLDLIEPYLIVTRSAYK